MEENVKIGKLENVKAAFLDVTQNKDSTLFLFSHFHISQFSHYSC